MFCDWKKILELFKEEFNEKRMIALSSNGYHVDSVEATSKLS